MSQEGRQVARAGILHLPEEGVEAAQVVVASAPEEAESERAVGVEGEETVGAGLVSSGGKPWLF
jgi:hypothetical protein